MNSYPFEAYQFPWINSFYNAVLANGRPDLTGPTLLITSDYSGNTKKSKFVTSSVLILDMNKAGDWNKQRHNVRESFLPNGREMSFKKLNDAHRRRALIPFLDAANSVQGLCVTIAMLKELYSFTRNGLLLETVIERASFPKGKWKVEPFEEMFITVYFVSLLIAAFATPNQNVYWVSDEDAMFANHAFSNDTVEVLSRLVSLYVKFPLGDLGVWTTSQLNNGMHFEDDLAAIPDLAAGAVSELINSIPPTNVLPKDQFRNWPEGLTEKTTVILGWLAKSSPALKKACIVFDKTEESPRMWPLLLG